MAHIEDTLAVTTSKSTSRRTVLEEKRHCAEPNVLIDPPLRDFARSHSINWRSPVPAIPEDQALQDLKNAWRRKPAALDQQNGRHTKNRPLICLELTDFEIYRSPNLGRGERRSELISLHFLEVPAPKKLCFDGYLRLDNVVHYVQGVDIHDYAIEGYGDDQSPGVVTYLQSVMASKDSRNDVWYRLVTPTADYRRFHEPFLWIAQLGKHVIDYMESQPAQSVALENFRQDFAQWLLMRFKDNKNFAAWHSEHKKRFDLRVAIHAHLDYVYHQAFNLDNSKTLLSHPVWGECMLKGMTSVKAREQIVQHTLATHNVHAAFKNMYFGKNILAKSPSPDVEQKQEQRKRRLGFTKTTGLKNPTRNMSCPQLRPYQGTPVKIGDVVAINSDEEDRKVWRNSNAQWLAYVQDIVVGSNGEQELSVLWLYRPCDTNIFKATYPFKNELFFSDNCNCGERKLLSADVAGRYSVVWSPDGIPLSRFFIRQTYVTQDSAFVSWEEEHKTCICKQPKGTPSEKYRQGDTMYVTRTVQSQKVLDPTIVWVIDDSTRTVTVRKLLRLGRDCSELAIQAGRKHIAPNELVLTDEYITMHASRIQRECFIRFVPHHQLDSVPSLFNRAGAGDRWFISMSLVAQEGAQLRFLSERSVCFRQPPEAKQLRKLRGLSIFSGGGSLDRGIEESGAVEFHTAVDFSPHAVHTQKANAFNPDLEVYCGSVDDYFKAALEGQDSRSIATVGSVDFIAAGSPCPGFSTLQQNFLSEASLRNASHISTFCSFVDLYRPLYGVLENVVSMTATRIGFENENVLSSVVACLVAMGYQVNQYIMDSWNYGSAQQRSRILLSIAAPGLTPIAQPWHTHSIPYENTASRSLGKLPNGERLGQRECYPTPFAALSAGQVTADLPDIGNGNVQTCIPYPDHVVTPPLTFMDRSLLRCIPRSPPGCGYTAAMKLGIIPKMLQSKKGETGKSYTRIKEAGLIPCITTKLRVADARNGATVHWAQDRPITIMDARRAQNYPDHEPIIGNLAQQFEIVGNGVDRMVSLALGLSLRQAMEKDSLNVAKVTAEDIIAKHKHGHWKANVVDYSESNGHLTDAMRPIFEVDITRDKSPLRKASKPLVVIPARSKIGKMLETPHPVARKVNTTHPVARNVNTTRRNQLDGLVHAPKRPEDAYVEQTVTQTVTTRFNDVSMSTTTSFSRSASILHGEKRPQEDDHEADDQIPPAVSVPQPASKKRMKTMANPRASSFLADRSTTSEDAIDTRATSTSSVASHHTRQSGFGIQFVPVNWNKRPEANQ